MPYRACLARTGQGITVFGLFAEWIQAKTWEGQFRWKPLNYSHISVKTFDLGQTKKGNIGAGRLEFCGPSAEINGLCPSPREMGDMKFGMVILPIIQKPNTLNPQQGFLRFGQSNVIQPDLWAFGMRFGYLGGSIRGDRTQGKYFLAQVKKINYGWIWKPYKLIYHSNSCTNSLCLFLLDLSPYRPNLPEAMGQTPRMGFYHWDQISLKQGNLW